jgi:hypothetical protein
MALEGKPPRSVTQLIAGDSMPGASEAAGAGTIHDQ